MADKWIIGKTTSGGGFAVSAAPIGVAVGADSPTGLAPGVYSIPGGPLAPPRTSIGRGFGNSIEPAPVGAIGARAAGYDVTAFGGAPVSAPSMTTNGSGGSGGASGLTAGSPAGGPLGPSIGAPFGSPGATFTVAGVGGESALAAPGGGFDPFRLAMIAALAALGVVIAVGVTREWAR